MSGKGTTIFGGGLGLELRVHFVWASESTSLKGNIAWEPLARDKDDALSGSLIGFATL